MPAEEREYTLSPWGMYFREHSWYLWTGRSDKTSPQGFTFRLGSKVTSATVQGDGVAATVEPAAGGAVETLGADVVLVAIGRVPYTDGLGLVEAGISLDGRKRIVVDTHFQTSVMGVYAIGDVIAGPMLAHKAEDEGVAVAEILSGQAGHVNYDVIPSVIYTSPEDRRRVESRGYRLHERQIPVPCERPRESKPDNRRLCEGARRLDDGPGSRRTHHRTERQRTDRRSSRHHGVRRVSGGSRADMPRPSDIVGSGQRGGAVGRHARDSYVTPGDLRPSVRVYK